MKKQPTATSFFQNTACEYFPCHASVESERFNCLFCYCPLYALDDKCGGDFTYTSDGVKDCQNCSLPHDRDNYEKIVSRFPDIVNMMKDQRVEPARSDHKTPSFERGRDHSDIFAGR